MGILTVVLSDGTETRRDETMACLGALVSTHYVLLVNQSRARLRSAPLHLLNWRHRRDCNLA
jgi:hypothetical protein